MRVIIACDGVKREINHPNGFDFIVGHNEAKDIVRALDAFIRSEAVYGVVPVRPWSWEHSATGGGPISWRAQA